jgi:hypothetical protein
MVKYLEAISFRNVTLKLIAAETLAAAGEALSGESSTEVTGELIAAWTRGVDTPAGALSTLLAKKEAVWRMLDDGKVWVGVDAWPASKTTASVKDVFHDQGFGETYPETFDLRPGTLFAGLQIRAVSYMLTDAHLRSNFWWENGSNRF